MKNLGDVLRITGLILAASAHYGAHAEQPNPAKATTFGYVANGEDNTVSVIDTGNNKVVATIPVGGFPDGVATMPDGTQAYVTNAFDNTVSVIDTASNKVVATIPVGNDPFGVAITPDGTHPYEGDDRLHQHLAYVTNEVDNTVSVIDTGSNTVVATTSVGRGPSGVAITPDGTHAYVTNQLDASVSVIDTDSNTVMATILVGGFPEGVAITPDGADRYGRDDRHQSLAYVTNQLDNTVSVIDTASNTVVATIPGSYGPEGIAITPDGSRAYVGNGEVNTVSVIDTANNTVAATIPVRTGPIGVAITRDETDRYERDGHRHQTLAYVTNFVDNTVSVIDTASNKVVATIPVGEFPGAVAFARVTPSHRSSEQ
jgi:YVTN family beta-propeller protein